MLFLGLAALLLIGASGEAPTTAAWEVRCRVDELTEVRRCSLRNGNLEPQFALLIEGPRGSPIVMPGVHDFPGRKATVRVDQNKAIVFAPGDNKDSAKQVALVEQLRQGKVARFEYHQWPDGARRASIDLAGFREAYEELLRERDQTGSTDWQAGAARPAVQAPEETPEAPLGPTIAFEVGPPVVSSDEVDRESLARYVGARKPAIQACHEKELRQLPGLAGRLRVRFVVSTSGRAAEINVEDNTLGNDAVAACIKSVIRTWVLPFKPGSDVSVVLPLAWTLEHKGDGGPEHDTAKQERERYYGVVSSAVRRLYEVPSKIPEAERVRLKADLALRVDSEGNLLEVKLITSSGNAAFDDAVLAATRKAAPFGPPPSPVRNALRNDGLRLRFVP